MGTDDDSKPFQKAEGLPIRFPKSSTLTFTPDGYRQLVEAMRQFGVYQQALEALEKNQVRIVLRSDQPDGVANALADMQRAVRDSKLYGFTQRLFSFQPENRPIAEEGCPIGKFMIEG